MKIRTDFVTNSSSASYIFGTAEDIDMTVQSVYEMIRSVYLEMIALVRNMAAQKEKCEQYGISIIINDKYDFKIEKSDCYYKWRPKRNEYMFSKEADCILHDIDYELGWLDCRTYEEYIEWCSRLRYPPFQLLDFADDDFSGNEDALVEAVDWYGIDIDEYYLGNLLAGGDCEQCRSYCILCDSYGKENHTECLEMKKQMENKTAEKQLLMRFGRIMLASPHELEIPFYVHERLNETAKYGCAHMG